MQVQFSINRLDLVRFNLHHAAHRPLTWSIVVILSALISSTVPTDITLGIRLILYALILLVISTIHFLATAAISLLSYAPAKNRGVFGVHDLSITSAEITETSHVNTSSWSWAAVPKVSQNHSYIFIYVQQNLAHIVPKRAFRSPEEAGQFYMTARSAWLSARSAA